MANPRPTFFTTGNCDTREELQRAVRALRGLGHNWTQIGKELGISSRSAKRIHDELEAIRKEARAAAYEVTERAEHAAEKVAAQTGLKPATVTYGALVLVLLLVMAAIAAFHG
jgi:hypothetical protein